MRQILVAVSKEFAECSCLVARAFFEQSVQGALRALARWNQPHAEARPYVCQRDQGLQYHNINCETPRTTGEAVKPDFQKGDWCFFEFNLCQIQEVDGARVRSVSDGSFNTRGNDLSDRCVVLSLKNSRITDYAEYWSSRLHKEGNNSLNFPDIHRKIVDLWLQACRARKESKEHYDNIAEFCNGILILISDEKDKEVDGVRIFNRR